MAKISTLGDLYTDELKDLWSAQDQMAKALKKIALQATNPKLSAMLERSQAEIPKHTELLKSLIESSGEKLQKEHCKGMEGLAAEAIKHAIDDAPPKGAVLDAAIIAQFQRMTHYGITGFGTVAAFAKALGKKDDFKTLERAVKDMYKGDDLMSELAESAINKSAV